MSMSNRCRSNRESALALASRRIAWAVVFLGGLSCGGDSPTGTQQIVAGPTAQLVIVTGDQQTGTVGTELPNSVVAKVTDAQGHAVKDQLVNFRVTAGGGSVFAGSAISNNDGEVRERWTIGTVAGATQELEARAVDNVTGEPIVFARFHATAVAGAASALHVVSEPGAAAQSGVPLSPAPALRLVDKYGNLVMQSGVQITAVIAPPADGRTLSGNAAVATNTEGIATFSGLAVVGAPGPVSLLFAASGLTGVASANISLTAGPPATLAAVSPTSTSGIAGGGALALPRVVVKDAAGNGVPGVTVAFEANAGTVTPATTVTDQNGEAQATQWTLPTQVGTATIDATTPALPNASAVFEAAVQPGPASKLSIVSGDGYSGGAGGVAPALVVHATDAHDNPVSGTAITWSIASGGGSLAATTSVTNEGGNAAATLTLPTTVGTTRVRAALPNGTAVTLTLTSVAGPPAALTREAGDNQPGVVGTAVSIRPQVRLSDAYGNGIAGSTVTFTVVEGGGSITGATPITDAGGRATLGSWTLGSTPGTNRVTATAGSLSATFTATATSQPATRIAIISGNPVTDTVGKVVPPLVVRTLNDAGDAMPGTVVWTATPISTTLAGGTPALSATTTSSGADGLTSVVATLQTRTGARTSGQASVKASLPNGAFVQFTLTAIAGPATTLTGSPATQTGEAETRLLNSLSAQVRDVYGNPADTVVDFVVTSGGGSVATPHTRTSEFGTAFTGWTLGPYVGTQTAEAHVGTLSFAYSATAVPHRVWRQMSSATANDLHDVWGTSASNVFAVGNAGTILHYDGAAWTSMSSGTTVALTRVWGASPSEVYASDETGVLLRYDGSSWSSVTYPPTPPVTGTVKMWVASPTRALAVVDGSAVYRWNGSTWLNETTVEIASAGFIDIDGRAAVGESAFSAQGRYNDGTGWHSGFFGQRTGSIHGKSYTDLFVVASGSGQCCFLRHFDGSSIGEFATPLSTGGGNLSFFFTPGWFVSNQELYIFQNGALKRITNLTLSEEGVWGTALWGTTSGELFLVGPGGSIWRKAP
jgi:hypothetical protein